MTANEYLNQQIGSIIITNATLQAKIDELQLVIVDLQKKITAYETAGTQQ